MHLPAFFCASGLLTHSGVRAPIAQASFSIPDTLFLLVIALVVFGPKRLPEISRKIGKILYEFRRASNDFKFQIEEELRLAEQAERQKQLSRQAAEFQPATPVALSAEETIAAAPNDSAPSTAEPPLSVSLPVESSAAEPAVAGLPGAIAEAAVPRIMPPATGEPVSALPPRRAVFSSSALTGVGEPPSEPSPRPSGQPSGSAEAPPSSASPTETRVDDASSFADSSAAYSNGNPASANHHG